MDKTKEVLQNAVITLKDVDFKEKMELIRFKQDCRKRALDMGLTEMINSGKSFNTKDVLGYSDIYYEWLIKEV